MNAFDFCKWLEGFLEGCHNNPSDEQIKTIRDKLKSVNGYSQVLPPAMFYPGLNPGLPSAPGWKPGEVWCGTSTIGPADTLLFNCGAAETTVGVNG